MAKGRQRNGTNGVGRRTIWRWTDPGRWSNRKVQGDDKGGRIHMMALNRGVRMETQATARNALHGIVAGGRSHGVGMCNVTLGMTRWGWR